MRIWWERQQGNVLNPDWSPRKHGTAVGRHRASGTGLVGCAGGNMSLDFLGHSHQRNSQSLAWTVDWCPGHPPSERNEVKVGLGTSKANLQKALNSCWFLLEHSLRSFRPPYKKFNDSHIAWRHCLRKTPREREAVRLQTPWLSSLESGWTGLPTMPAPAPPASQPHAGPWWDLLAKSSQLQFREQKTRIFL